MATPQAAPGRMLVTRWSQAEADINAAFARSSRADITPHPVLEPISSVATTEPIAALTFDDGPHPRYTPKLLEILKRYDTKATFFMVGKAARRYPELVKAVADAGHVIGNHSWDHPSFPSLTRLERLSQVLRCAAALSPYGYTLFRPPYGHQNASTNMDPWVLGYQSIAWSLDSKDWMGYPSAWVADRLRRRLKRGDIVVLHEDDPASLEAVEILLRQRNEQIRFVTIPVLLQSGIQQKKQRRRTAMHIINLLVDLVRLRLGC